MLHLSEFESNFFNLRIARYELKDLNKETEQQLISSSAQQSVDIIRLKLDLSVGNYQQFINSLSVPVFFSGGITEYIVTQNNYNFSTVRQKLEFVKITTSDIPLFKEFFYKTFNEHDIGYHTAPYLLPLISIKQELDCLYAFYEQFITKNNHEVIFLKKENKIVGFSTFQVTDENVLLIPIAGILPEFRSIGLYHDLIEAYLSYIFLNKFEKCIFSSRLDNYAARHIYSKFGFIHYGTKFNYMLTPFFNYQASVDSITINDRHYVDTQMDWILINNEIMQEYGLSKLQLKSFRRSLFFNIMKDSACSIQIRPVYKNSKHALFVCKWTQKDQLRQIAWLEYECME